DLRAVVVPCPWPAQHLALIPGGRGRLHPVPDLDRLGGGREQGGEVVGGQGVVVRLARVCDAGAFGYSPQPVDLDLHRCSQFFHGAGGGDDATARRTYTATAAAASR